jgi:PAS domain S-box-containing protein
VARIALPLAESNTKIEAEIGFLVNHRARTREPCDAQVLSPARQSRRTLASTGNLHSQTARASRTMTERDGNATKQEPASAQPDLSELLESLPGFAYQRRNDENWSTEYASARFKDFVGPTTADLLAQGNLCYASLIHPDDKARVVHDLLSALEQRRHYDLEYRINLADRGERWFSERGRGLYDKHDKPLSLIGFVTDITERKLAESKLQRSEHKFRQLFEASLDAITP